MIKLYKRNADGVITHYHEAWAEPARRRIVEHWGELGHQGETAVHRIKFFRALDKQFDDVLDPVRATGFANVQDADFALLVVEYPAGALAEPKPDQDDGDVADRLHEILGWTGLGYCDGIDEGPDGTDVSCFVLDVDLATRLIGEVLDGSEFANYSRIYQE